MKFSNTTLKHLCDFADNHRLLIIEGRNAIGEKFKTAGCIMPDKNSMGEHIYIQDYGFALFQGQYDNHGNKKFCAFFIEPNYNHSLENCLFIDSIRVQKQEIYQNPDKMKLSAYNYYNKIMRPENVDFTPTKMHSFLSQHIGRPILYKNEGGTLKRLDSKNGDTFAIITNGKKDLEVKLNPFEIHTDYDARHNLLTYVSENENEQ